jgi:hypothetical protein
MRGPVFRSTNPSLGRSLTTPLVRLRPLQGPTRHGPPTHDHTVAPMVTSRSVAPRGRLALGHQWASSRPASPKGRLALGRPSRVSESPITPKGHREPSRPEGPPSCRCRQLSWSFLPLRRLSSGESTPPRLASPGTFRPQGFTPSRRITPRPDARPCFVPETPMGFSTLQGFSLTARSRRLVASGLPS